MSIFYVKNMVKQFLKKIVKVYLYEIEKILDIL